MTTVKPIHTSLVVALMALSALYLARSATAQQGSVASVVHLSSLTPVGIPVSGHGPIERDRSNGEEAAGDGMPIRIRGTSYARGLGVHAPSDITFALNKQFARFSAVVGVDDELLTNECAPRFPGSVVFQVYVDDVKAYESGVVTVASPGQTVDVDVTGKSRLRLVVSQDLGTVCDHADWADAKLIANSGPAAATSPDKR